MEVNYYTEVVYKVNGKIMRQNFYGITVGKTKKGDIEGIIKMNHPFDNVKIMSNKLRVAF